MGAPSASLTRRRRHGEETVGLHVKVPDTTRAAANDAAASMGITMGRYIEILVARDLRDERGRSSWATPGVDLTKTIPMPPEQGDVAA